MTAEENEVATTDRDFYPRDSIVIRDLSSLLGSAINEESLIESSRSSTDVTSAIGRDSDNVLSNNNGNTLSIKEGTDVIVNNETIVKDGCTFTANDAGTTTSTDRSLNTLNKKRVCCSMFSRCGPFCNVFDGVAEAEGYAATGIGKGATLMANVFLTTSLVYLAEEQAGCFTSSGGNSTIEECTNTIYGVKASSLIPMVGVIGGLLSAFLLPLVGATVDFTPHRKNVGMVCCLFLIAVHICQIGTISSTWFAMLLLQVVSIMSYDIQNMASTAYFPELARKVGEKKTTKYQASFSVSIFVSEIIYLAFISFMSTAFGLDTIRTSQLAQGVSAFILMIVFGYGWWRLPEVPPLRERNNSGDNLLVEGSKQLWKTLVGINEHYGQTLRWFFIATCFAEAGSNAFTSLSVTYMTSVLKTTGIENGLIFMATLVFCAIGSKVGSLVTKKWNPIISMQIALSLFIVITIVGGLVMTGPEEKMLLYLFGPLWGLVIGWQYTSQHTFFSLCLPQGQQAELSGIYTYCQIILNWLPPLLFSTVNEAGISMRFALMTLVVFLFVAIIIQAFCLAPWDECRELSNTISKNITVTINENNDDNKEKEDGNDKDISGSGNVTTTITTAASSDIRVLEEGDNDGNTSTKADQSVVVVSTNPSEV